MQSSSIGKAFLGSLREAELRQWLAGRTLSAITPSTITDSQKLLPDIRRGRRLGYFQTRGEKALNPKTEPLIQKFGTTYLVGDKVMQTDNDYDKEVYNGDLGFIAGIDLEAGEIKITFDGREVTYIPGELDQVVLAYATSFRKSPGSEYPVVVIPMMTQH